MRGKKLGLIFLFVAVIALVVTLIFISERQKQLEVDAATVTLQFVTASTSVKQGNSFNVDIFINTNGLKVSGADLRIKYDSTKLTAESITQGNFLTANFIPGKITPGLASIVMGSDPTAPVAGTGILATVKFKAISVGSTSITFDPESGISALNQGVNVAGTLPVLNLTMTSTTATTAPGVPTAVSPMGVIACPTANMVPVMFTWKAPAIGAGSYYLRIDDFSNSWIGCPSANAGDFCIPGITGLSHTLNLPANKNYRWWIQAISTTGVAGFTSALTNFSIPPVCVVTPKPTPTPMPSLSPTRRPSTSTPKPTATPVKTPTATKTPMATKTPTPKPGSTMTPKPSSMPTMTPTPASMMGDINNDGKVNTVDIGIIVDNYLLDPLPDARADISGDGIANIVDIGIIIDNYRP